MEKRSLLLNNNWDITLDYDGNIATTRGLYCDAQNVANATRLFTKDAFLAQTQGIPHFDVDLGVVPALSEVRAWYRNAAMGVENIQSASIEITGLNPDTRTLEGTITATVESGKQITIEI